MDHEETDAREMAMQAAAVAKKGILAKASGVAAVVFLIGIIVLGSLAPVPSASATDCEDTGPGTGETSTSGSIGGGKADEGTTDGEKGGDSLHKQQIAHAKTIDAQAKKAGLPGRATLIALMTAMQESTLQNLGQQAYSADSLGLFQQRPSQRWGSKKHIMIPSYAAESFFQGRGGNDGLADIKGWQTMPLGDAAQKVQKSAYPRLYAGHESKMRKLAGEAGIDLDRPGSSKGGGKAEGSNNDAEDTAPDADVDSSNDNCEPEKPPASKGSAGGRFTDGEDSWELDNPRGLQDAIQWAKDHDGDYDPKWHRMCLAFTAQVYGWNQSGVTYAIDHFSVVPKSMQHKGDRSPPPGALMYWRTDQRAGHIAVYVGGGKIATNDIEKPGRIDVVDAQLIETKWGATYVGWTPPVFPKGG
ncbi:hypothetical protein [Streptomyces nanshensis]|uniref:NlpC/P60 domain-containing protein n=1 Tax=Streptomyces nanshensis TaxID=518642 RepID=A0A1E7KZH3_9ACTN|nr:hypothetical protein [Streptomyces nanshensis]OEV09330.1 hypothetical protein AN218_23180 [Streptomyces nanshensis]